MAAPVPQLALEGIAAAIRGSWSLRQTAGAAVLGSTGVKSSRSINSGGLGTGQCGNVAPAGHSMSNGLGHVGPQEGLPCC
jgi:hypothetical protein